MHFRGSKNRNNVTKFTLGGVFFTISKKVVLPLPFTPPTITTSNDRSHICITHICTPFLIYVTVVNLGGGGRGLIQPFSNLWAILETFIKKNPLKTCISIADAYPPPLPLLQNDPGPPFPKYFDLLLASWEFCLVLLFHKETKSR